MQSFWPYALAVVLLLALVILVLLVLLLKRSARVSRFEDGAEEPAVAPAAGPAPPPEAGQAAGLRQVFSHAGKRLDRYARGDRHEIPLFLLLGAEGSRDPDLLAGAGLDLPFGAPQEAGLDLGKGRGFWFFDHGIVLDLAGEQVLQTDGRSADERGWRTMLHLLQRLRPKRPADGVILTLSCAELLPGALKEQGLADLADRAERLYRKLGGMQRRLGFRLPVYVLVTGCERLPGFGGFCAPLQPPVRREMLGWSSPYTADTAYRGAWTEEAFAALGGRLEDLEMEVYAEGGEGAEEVFLLSEAVASLRSPLQVYFDHLFKASAYGEALVLRGVYLCGQPTAEPASKAAAGGPAAPSSARTAFLEHLFVEKVFPESALARPTTQTVLSRNRAVRIARWSTAAAALLLVGGLLRGGWSLQHDRDLALPFLEETLQHLRAGRLQAHQQIADADLESWALHLLDGMARVDFNRFGSLFVPSSWFSPFNRRLEDALSQAFNEVILRAIRRELEEDVHVRITEAAVSEMAPARPAEGSAALPIESMPEFRQLQRYIQGLRAVEENGRRFNSLSLRGSGDLRTLADLVNAAFGRRLPESFFQHAHLYRDALRNANYEDFQPAAFRAEAAPRAEELAARLFAALFRRNPLDARLEALAVRLQQLAWRWPESGDTEPFSDLVRRLDEVEILLSQPDLEYAFRREFNLGASFNRMLSGLESSAFFGPDVARRVRASGAAGWADLGTRLATRGSTLTGPLLQVAGGRAEMQLSPDTLLLKTALRTFLGQEFVAPSIGPERLWVELPAGTRLTWDAPLLGRSVAAGQAYERFQAKSLGLFPAELRGAIDGVARERTRTQMLSLIAEAQRFEPVPPAVSAGLFEQQLQRDVASFQTGTVPLGDALQALGRLRFEEARRGAASAMTWEAFRLLQETDRLLLADEPYRPSQGGFAWWDGSRPASPAAWGARDPAEVAAYLDTTRSRLIVLARNYAQPALAWLATAGGFEGRPEIRTLARKWQGVLDDLRDYEGKKPGNPLSALEEFITSDMTKVGTADCTAASPAAASRPASGFFAATLYDLTRRLSGRCYDLAGEQAAARYAEMARFFNQRLAGRYPFAEEPPEPGDPEAAAEDLRGFYKLFDASQAMVRSLPAKGDRPTPSFRAVRGFLDDMARVRELFAPFLDAEKPEPVPSFDVEASFRVLREREAGGNQIIDWTLVVGNHAVTSRGQERKLRWTLGEPVRIEMRWANDAPSVPVLLRPRAGAAVRDRTVIYEYANRWALLAALADHRAAAADLPAYEDVEPVTLALAVDTRPAAGGPPSDTPTRVFLRLALLAPGTTKRVDPPLSAPEGEGEAEERRVAPGPTKSLDSPSFPARFPVRAPRLDEVFAEETP
jgi:type VI secretion system protein ImpL